MAKDFFLDRHIKKNQENVITLLKEQDVTSWFFRMSAGTKLKCVLNNSFQKSFKKNKNCALFKGYIYTRGVSAILTINAHKWRRSAANCKEKQLNLKQISRCLPNLQETLSGVKSFHPICLKITVKLKRYTLYREINSDFEQKLHFLVKLTKS